MNRSAFLCLVLALVALVACNSNDGKGGSGSSGDLCQPDLGFPYGHSTYASNHSDAGNSDFIPCDGPASYAFDYHVLQGHVHAQPNTYSPDGQVTYATTTPGGDGCSVHAIRVATGDILWQRCGDFTAAIIASAVEVDQDGILYLTDDATVCSLNPDDGSTRWQTPLPDNGPLHNAFGVKFAPEGFIVTQVSDGTVYLLQRDNGEILDSFDVAAEFGFVAPRPLNLSLLSLLLPRHIRERIGEVMGTEDVDLASLGLGALLGASGAFTDNTVAVSIDNQVFAVGGGPDPNTGAQVALNIEAGPKLTPAWYALLDAGSAASSAISKDGQRLVVADGTNHVLMLDIPKCNENLDAEPDPLVCQPSWIYRVEAGAPLGSVTIDNDHRIVVSTFGKNDLPALEMIADRGDHPEVLWSQNYGNWVGLSSVATATNNYIYGILTEVDLFFAWRDFPIPRSTINWAVAIDRSTGEIVHRVSEPDDSECELQLAPDGSLFSTHMAVMSIISLDGGARQPLGGLIHYTPTQ